MGNSLAVRLPAAVVEALELREGDDIELHVEGERSLAVARKPDRDALIARLRAIPWSPAGRFQVRSGRGEWPVVFSTPMS